MDFLLSLSTQAKEKLAKASLPPNANKSVIYADQKLKEEDVSTSPHIQRALMTFTPARSFTLGSLLTVLGQMGP
jgi:THO complex subunit 1